MIIEKNKLFVGNLDGRVKRFHLKEFFAQYGEVTYTKVAFEKETKRSRGFGFVVFADEQAAANALEKWQGAILTVGDLSFPEKPLRLMYAETTPERAQAHAEHQNAKAEETETTIAE